MGGGAPLEVRRALFGNIDATATSHAEQGYWWGKLSSIGATIGFVFNFRFSLNINFYFFSFLNRTLFK